MNCRKVQSYLSAYCEGILSSDRVEKLEVHIKSCKRCEQEKQFTERILMAARALPTRSLPEDFNLQLLNRIYAEQSRPTESYLPTEPRSLFGRRLGWLSALAAVSVCALVAVLVLTPDHTSLNPTESVPAYTSVEPMKVTHTSATRHTQPVRIYDDIIGVSGPSSHYRATSLDALRTMRVSGSPLESLFVAFQQRRDSMPAVGYGNSWRRSRINNANGLILQNAASRR
ncbi:MAG: zf-HC2 domain-containing protein [candidate division Zixibacteria bacterium]|nr:zf-HC2 domain-containing protein [candidate division Zixibacteria bacterium]